MEAGINHALELIVIEAMLCLLLVSFFFERTPRQRKLFRWLFAAVAVLSVGNYFNFGDFQGHGQQLSRHEQFHFFLGSKYLSELRYDAIYDATLLAGLEELLFDNTRTRRRDPLTFEVLPLVISRERSAEIHGRFTPQRWREFRKDLHFFFGSFNGQVGKMLTDHGNTGSPTWAMTAGLFTGTLQLNRGSAHLFAYLDVLLLLILFVTVRQTLGARTMALAMVIGLSVPLVYNMLGGSILRMDWIFALGMSVCLFERRHFRTAGIFLGYAVASKLLAGIMVLPFGLRFLVKAIQNRRVDRDHLRYILFAVYGLALFVLLSVLYFADASMWQDYYQRMLVTYQEKYYRIQHSFRDLFLQARYYTGNAWHPFPERVAAANPEIFIDNVRPAFVAAQAVLLAGLAWIAARNPARVAFALGPLAVFVILVTNRYYWEMWMISALALAPAYHEDWRHTGFLAAILAWLGALNVAQMSRFAVERGGYLGSYLLFWIGAALLSFELISWYRRRRLDSPGSAAQILR